MTRAPSIQRPPMSQAHPLNLPRASSPLHQDGARAPANLSGSARWRAISADAARPQGNEGATHVQHPFAARRFGSPTSGSSASIASRRRSSRLSSPGTHCCSSAARHREDLPAQHAVRGDRTRAPPLQREPDLVRRSRRLPVSRRGAHRRPLPPDAGHGLGAESVLIDEISRCKPGGTRTGSSRWSASAASGPPARRTHLSLGRHESVHVGPGRHRATRDPCRRALSAQLSTGDYSYAGSFKSLRNRSGTGSRRCHRTVIGWFPSQFTKSTGPQ